MVIIKNYNANNLYLVIVLFTITVAVVSVVLRYVSLFCFLSDKAAESLPIC